MFYSRGQYLGWGGGVAAKTFSESRRIHSSAKISSVSIQQVGNPWVAGGRWTHESCVSSFLSLFLAVLGSGAGSCRALRRQQWGFEGAGSGTLTRGEHLAGKMVKGVMSFWGGTCPSVRTCRQMQTTTSQIIVQFTGVSCFFLFFT